MIRKQRIREGLASREPGDNVRPRRIRLTRATGKKIIACIFILFVALIIIYGSTKNGNENRELAEEKCEEHGLTYDAKFEDEVTCLDNKTGELTEFKYKNG